MTIEAGTKGARPKDLKMHVIVDKEINGSEKSITNLDERKREKRKRRRKIKEKKSTARGVPKRSPI